MRKGLILWVDEEFMDKLKRIKAKRTLNGMKTESFTDLTRRIIKSKSFQQIENELLEQSNDFALRFDQ